MRAAGLEVVSVKKYRWPYGDWYVSLHTVHRPQPIQYRMLAMALDFGGCDDTRRPQASLAMKYPHAEIVLRLAKAGHPETLSAGQIFVNLTLPMVRVHCGKLLGDAYSKDRVAGLQAELMRFAERTPRLYIPYIVTVGRKR